MKVIPLHRDHDCYDIAKTLRTIADDVEAGVYDFAPTQAVVVIATETTSSDGLTMRYNWRTHGLGKGSFFAAKGLLACAATSFEGGQ